MRIPSLVLSLTFSLATCFYAQANNVNSVDVYQAKASQTSQSLSLTGTVEAKQHAELATLESGVVESLYVEVGDVVEKGQKLLSLDAKLAKLNVERVKALKAAAQAQKTEAERLYKEVVSLSKQQLVAETLLNERLSALAIAKAELSRVDAELAQALEVLSRHTLIAPFSGVIAERQIDVGEWVTQQSSVLTLVEQQSLRLKVAIPQEYYQQLNASGDVSVVVTPDVAGASSITAKLNRLVGVAANSSRTVTGLVYLPNNAALVVGMSAKASVYLPASETTQVWLPKSAIKQHPDGGRSVFVVDNNKASRVLVKVAKTDGNLVAVTGTSADKPFVVSGVELLRDGDRVQVNKVNKAEGVQ